MFFNPAGETMPTRTGGGPEDAWHPMPTTGSHESQPGKPRSWIQFMFPGFSLRTFTFAIAMINIVVFVASLLLPSSTPPVMTFARFLEPPQCSMYKMGAKWAPGIRYGHEAWRLVLPAFLHGGLWHILENTLAALFLGFLPERAFSAKQTGTHMFDAPMDVVGSVKAAFLFFTCAAAGSLCSCLGDSKQLSVGASSGIMGMLGAIAAIMSIIWLQRLYPSCACWCASALPPDLQRYRSMAWMTAILVAMTYILGAIPGPTDNWGHLGGMVMGFFLAPCLIPRLLEDGGGGGAAAKHLKRGYIWLFAALSVLFVGLLVMGLFIMPLPNAQMTCP